MKVSKTKKGAAAMYTVIITTMVVMVIAVSLVRIVLAEATRTTNESLSSSAYNSALAGVEDGKTLILKYEKCLDTYGTPAKANEAGNTECYNILQYFLNGELEGDYNDMCDAIQVLLYGSTNPEEMKISSGSGSGESMEQAYSCVNISSGKDYVGKIDPARNYRSVPIRMSGDANNLSSIVVEWYTKSNAESAAESGTVKDMELVDDGISAKDLMEKAHIEITSPTPSIYRFKSGISSDVSSSTEVQTPPPIKIDYYQTPEVFKLSDFYAGVRVSESYGRTNRATMTLYPSSNDEAIGSNGVALEQKDTLATSLKIAANPVIPAHCDLGESTGYICKAEFKIPDTIDTDSEGKPSGSGISRNKDTMLFRISTIYGIPEDVDFRISLKSDSGEIRFKDVQYIIDSTGRANNLYRRVEARVDTANVYFPEPNYELQVGGTGGTTDLKKKIKITQDCKVYKNGERQDCKDGKGEAESTFNKDE